MPQLAQETRHMALLKPLPDTLFAVGLTGHEGISQLFSYQLDVIAEKQKTVSFDAVLGQPTTVETLLPGGGKRYLSGICSRFSQGDQDNQFTSYRLEIVPKLWLLTRRAQSRIFQQMSVKDILKKVLTGIDLDDQLQGTYQPRDYCVQYRETDFNFISRLMEEEGIFYFFTHSAGGHKLVLADSASAHPDVPGKTGLIYEGMAGGSRTDDRIHDWQKVQELRATEVRLWDHCFEDPPKNYESVSPIQANVQAGTVSHNLKLSANGDASIYDWPGEYAQRFDGVAPGGGDRPADVGKIPDDGKRTVGLRMQEEAVHSLSVQGAGTCRQLTAGHKFTLDRHYNANGAYVLTAVSVSAQQEGYRAGEDGAYHYHNSFTCIPAALPFRPPRTTPKPVVPGTQTAVVVGPKGEEIFTDKYGRVKVQFFWDRDGKMDANSSCWIRVAQVWAGKRWGASFWPRIGQEVVVAFEEGDPDRPIIVGSVYNAEQMPPYLGDGPDGKHPKDNKVSGIKTNTTTGGKGFNELRFDDTKGKEEIFIHAEHDMDVRVKNESRERVISNRHLIVGFKDESGEDDAQPGGDQRELVHQDKHLNVKRDQQEKVEGNCFLTVGKGEASDGGNMDVVIEKNLSELIEQKHQLHIKQDQLVLIDGTQGLTVTGDKSEKLGQNSHLQVGMNRNEKVGMNQSLQVGMCQYEKVGMSHALDSGMTIHLKSGLSFVLEAGVQLTLKVGGNFIDINPAGVFIQGTLVMINSGGGPGSGSGSSPQDPQDPNKPPDANEAKPTKPDLADDSKTGSKSAPS